LRKRVRPFPPPPPQTKPLTCGFPKKICFSSPKIQRMTGLSSIFSLFTFDFCASCSLCDPRCNCISLFSPPPLVPQPPSASMHPSPVEGVLGLRKSTLPPFCFPHRTATSDNGPPGIPRFGSIDCPTGYLVFPPMISLLSFFLEDHLFPFSSGRIIPRDLKLWYFQKSRLSSVDGWVMCFSLQSPPFLSIVMHSI